MATRTTKAETFISRDMVCRKCGYNLRGLSARGSCPECGEPVFQSRLVRPMHLGDRALLRRYRGAMRLIGASLILTLIASVGALGMVLSEWPWDEVIRTRLMFLIVEYVLWVAGVWLVTVVPNFEDPEAMEEHHRLRRTIRWTTGGAVTAMAIAWTGLIFEFAEGYDLGSVLRMLGFAVAMMAMAMSVWELGRYFSELAKSLPDLDLSVKAMTAGYLGVGSAVTVMIAALLMPETTEAGLAAVAVAVVATLAAYAMAGFVMAKLDFTLGRLMNSAEEPTEE